MYDLVVLVQVLYWCVDDVYQVGEGEQYEQGQVQVDVQFVDQVYWCDGFGCCQWMQGDDGLGLVGEYYYY